MTDARGSDFLTRLIGRAFGDAPAIEARMPSVFETEADRFHAPASTDETPHGNRPSAGMFPPPDGESATTIGASRHASHAPPARTRSAPISLRQTGRAEVETWKTPSQETHSSERGARDIALHEGPRAGKLSPSHQVPSAQASPTVVRAVASTTSETVAPKTAETATKSATRAAGARTGYGLGQVETRIPSVRAADSHSGAESARSARSLRHSRASQDEAPQKKAESMIEGGTLVPVVARVRPFSAQSVTRQASPLRGNSVAGREPPSPNVVNVTIGRVEVRATKTPAPRVTAKNATRPMSLDDYLKRRGNS